MPSFIIHSVVGEELSKRLGFSEEEHNKFFVANLLPDTVKLEIDPNWDSVQLRHAIQRVKKTTHFRTNDDAILSHPDLKYFLDKYDDLVKTDIITFGYFVHLYTDWYYFTKFLPKMITFLCEDKKSLATIKKDNKYNRINKNNELMAKEDFWSKINKDGIYGEYSRLNKYIIEKYNFKYDYELYKKIINNDFNILIEEVNSDGIDNLLDELNNFYKESLESELEDFKIFDSCDVDNLINDVVDSFLLEYSYLIK